ncbi:MAG: hypothetical protein AAGF10_04370 [Verrucomicrobiota bacterium]
MTRRSTLKRNHDKQRFPVKVRFRVESELPDWSQRYQAIHDWLMAEVGLDRHAVHADSVPGIHCFAVYLEDVETARRLVEAVGIEPMLLTEEERAVFRW